jgi:DNA repair protein RecN (Recombination protein N)
VLVGLSIRQIVLVDRLDLELSNGLCVVTGETGAGKSVLLDALGLALGERADSGLIRPGVERGWVSASFELGDNHPVLAFLEAHGLRSEASLLLRRTGAADGRSRAFVNDQPVSVGLLRQLGKMLVEIHGQANHADLTDPANQLAMLDSFGGLAAEVARVGEFFDAARRAEYELTQAQEGLASAQADEEYMRHALGELEQLAPTIGEEQELAATRRVLMESDRLLEALDSALALLAEDGGPRARLVAAERALSSVASAAAGRLGGAMAALSQASIETEEATTAVVAAAADLRPDPERLEQVEERLFALRALARKHRLEVDGLPELRRNLVQQLRRGAGPGDGCRARRIPRRGAVFERGAPGDRQAPRCGHNERT